jgi:uncharacterized protein YqeY
MATILARSTAIRNQTQALIVVGLLFAQALIAVGLLFAQALIVVGLLFAQALIVVGLLFAQALIAGVASAPMAELKARLQADLTAAMKAQDRLRTATLRMLLTAIRNEEVSGKQSRELSDDEVIKVLAKESKKRSEAAEIYTQNGRGELAANEHAEARVIDEYLPTPLTEAELADVADTAIAQVAEQLGERPTMKQMGQVMKAATAIAAGKADGARLSAAVKDRL